MKNVSLSEKNRVILIDSMKLAEIGSKDLKIPLTL